MCLQTIYFTGRSAGAKFYIAKFYYKQDAPLEQIDKTLTSQAEKIYKYKKSHRDDMFVVKINLLKTAPAERSVNLYI